MQQDVTKESEQRVQSCGCITGSYERQRVIMYLLAQGSVAGAARTDMTRQPPPPVLLLRGAVPAPAARDPATRHRTVFKCTIVHAMVIGSDIGRPACEASRAGSMIAQTVDRRVCS